MFKMNKLVLLLLFIFLVPLVLADTSYNETGNFDSYFQLGIGIFNTDSLETLTASKSITNQEQTPLVTDLDNDGVNEIIVLDSPTFLLFQTRDLNLINSFTLPANEFYSNFITFDIDGNGFTNVIIAMEESEIIQILEFNGTSFKNISSMKFDFLTHDSATATVGEIMIKCSDTERCLMTYAETKKNPVIGLAQNKKLFAVFFNSTTIGSELEISSTGVTFATYCSPKIRTITAIDLDKIDSGRKEFVFSWMEYDQTSGDSGEDIHIFSIDVVSPNNTLVKELQKVETEPFQLGGNAVNRDCEIENMGRFFSSPLVFDAVTGGEPEIIQAYNVDTNSYVIRIYDDIGSSLDVFPSIITSDGQLISNLFRADIFEQNNKDFCVMGYCTTEFGGCLNNELNLLCGTKSNSFAFQDSIIFDFDTNELFNITQTAGLWNVITHSGQHSQIETQGGVDTSEILNAYGVFQLDFSGVLCTLFAFCTLDLLFENPQGDSVLIASDVERVGQEDLLVLTSTNIIYIDDKFTNSPASIASTNDAFNPCINAGTIRINTTTTIQFIVNDDNEPPNDIVSARLLLYADLPNEQDTGFVNGSAGQTFSFSIDQNGNNLLYNQTVTNGIIRLEAFDPIGNPLLDTIDKRFSVGINGVEFNDCSNDLVIVPVDDVNVSITGAGFLAEGATEANTIRDATNSLSNITGLGGATLWLILMFIVTVLIITGTTGISISTLGKVDTTAMMAGLIGALLADAIIFVVAAINGVFSAGIIFMVFLIFLVIIVAIGSRFIFASAPTGGGAR